MQTFKSSRHIRICRHILTSYYSPLPGLTYRLFPEITRPKLCMCLKFLPWAIHVLQVRLLVQSPWYRVNIKYDKAMHYAVFSQLVFSSEPRSQKQSTYSFDIQNFWHTYKQVKSHFMNFNLHGFGEGMSFCENSGQF